MNVIQFPQPYDVGAILEIPGVQQSDAGVYRCIGQNGYGQSSYEDFNLEVLGKWFSYIYNFF